MRKLKLDLDALAVDSFDTLASQERKGTVVGLATHVSPCQPTEYTRCWGLCGETENTGLRCPAWTAETCTYDPYAIDCISYAEPCDASMVPTNCPSDPTCYYTTCRDSVTAC